MSLEQCILKGKNNKKTREQLMLEANLDRDSFKKELARIKETKIVLFDNGYYMPNTIEEYENFKRKCKQEILNIKKLFYLAKKEEELLWLKAESCR